jgi:hypothetical protein
MGIEWFAGPAAADRKANVDLLYRLIIQFVDKDKAPSGEWSAQPALYTSKRNPKALVACINWRETTPTRWTGKYGFRTGSSQSPPASIEVAVAEATTHCVNTGCPRASCAVVDRNGQNALQPPADWFPN